MIEMCCNISKLIKFTLSNWFSNSFNLCLYIICIYTIQGALVSNIFPDKETLVCKMIEAPGYMHQG